MRAALALPLLTAWAIAQAGAVPVDVRKTLQLAGKELEAGFRSRYPDLTRVEVTPVSANLNVPVTARELRPQIPEALPLGRRVRVWLEVIQDGQRAPVLLPVWYEVHAYKPVAVLARALHPRQAIQADDVVIREADVTGKQPITERVITAGAWRAQRYLPADRVLRAGDLEPVPPVQAEQAVSVRVASGPIVIESTGIAEQEGRIGQTIRVRNQKSEARFLAQVTGAQQVEVAAK